MDGYSSANMIFPVGKTINKKLDPLWYIAQGFGVKTSYGYHEGLDLNLRSSGDSDLGQPLLAVADGKIGFYHNNTHPTSGFGRHMILECETSRGTRWYMYSHCQEITAEVKTVKMGDVIGKLGKSGTSAAHLHFSVFKVNPSTIGIDNVANSESELGAYWEKFELLDTASPPEPEPMPTELQTYLGVQNDTEAKTKIKEHLGELNDRCDWGNAEGNRGGYLGDARRKLATSSTQPPEQITVNGKPWKLNGIASNDNKLIGNYERA